MSKDIRIYVDMDDVLCDYTKSYLDALKKEPKIKYPQSQYGFFRNLKPKESAITIFKILSKRFDVWILSSPPINNPLSYSEKREWVETHLGFEYCERLILSTNKSLLIGDFLIDDIKQDNFKGEQILFGKEPYDDWHKVYGYFKERFQMSIHD